MPIDRSADESREPLTDLPAAVVRMLIRPISLLTLHPTNIARLKLSRKSPMDMRIPPL